MSGILVGEIASIVPRNGAKRRRKVIGKSPVSCYSPAMHPRLAPTAAALLAFTLIMGGIVVSSRR